MVDFAMNYQVCDVYFLGRNYYSLRSQRHSKSSVL